MPVIAPEMIEDHYDLVIGGTGFGSMFFLHGYRRRFPRARVLLVEWGGFHDRSWQIENQRNSDTDAAQTFVQDPDEKPWFFTLGFGGGTNCWWANTPRLSPNDFRLRTMYGVGEDWPISYEDLEPYYVAAEQIMLVAGPNDLGCRYPRSAPYPQPAHNLSSVDRIMKSAMPDHHFAVPTARLRTPVGDRGPCCDSVQCNLCPLDAKFTALNTFGEHMDAPTVHVLPNARVLSVELEGGVAKGLRYSTGGREQVVTGDLVAIGCNAIHSPFILMRSGLFHPALGKYLHEKHVLQFEVLLDGVDHFDGGIPTAGLNTLMVDGEHRREGGAALVYFINHYFRDGLRAEWGRWRQTLPMEVFVEDLPLEANKVFDEGGEMPAVSHPRRSSYCDKGVEHVIAKLPQLLAPLPVERIIRRQDLPTGFHIQGTCRMGKDRAQSIVDGGLVHHDVRNLLVLGTSVWPSCGTANPSLTAAALSLRAAALIGG
ncbi:choline dehydrogenase-like flavoprotein [Sinorhizobium kostiense]|uniref:Choline dehydrogenase-like flavoprotein n=1 Tax=Sinorhizobium kostiense TaxID=76747 RepID=A0ABS4QXM2_9HYPH|nr:GMC family oxidoreductase [Sinorhizobium kostiense]MBP2234735.1 choline dehydrogenase-like flavoprotein [Sinorhizobium kostiense]